MMPHQRTGEGDARGVKDVGHGVNANQVGGDHYRSEYQHWDFIELNGIGYLEAAATKYATRWRKKGTPMQDLEKALHYTQKLVELYRAKRRLPRGIAPIADVHRFCEANNLSPEEARVTALLTRWVDERDLQEAMEWIRKLMAECEAIQNRPDETGQANPRGFDPDEEMTGDSLRRAQEEINREQGSERSHAGAPKRT